jgi:hypothetical protein
MVFINLAIMSDSLGDSIMAEAYLKKIEDAPCDEFSKKTAKHFLDKGFNGAKCIGFPVGLCMAPPGYRDSQGELEITPKQFGIRKDAEIVTKKEPEIVTKKDAEIVTKKELEIVTKKDAEIVTKKEPEKANEAAKSNGTTDRIDTSNTLIKGSAQVKSYPSMLPTPPLENTPSNFTNDDKELPHFYRYLEKPVAIDTISRSASGKGISNIISAYMESPKEEVYDTSNYFPEIAHVQLFGIWRPFAVCLEGQDLKLCNEKLLSDVNLVIKLQSCRIEPATDTTFKKLHLFKLIIDTDEYLFALDSLKTSLEWISKIINASLNISGKREVKLLRTGLGREPYSP